MNGRPTPGSHADLLLEQRLSIGQNTGRGNLVGIQPYLVPQDYRTAVDLHAKLAGYLDAASSEGWLQDRTVVVFPEHIGTWLVAADERDSVYMARTVTEALRPILLNHPLTFMRQLGASIGKAADLVRSALFRTKAAQMARDYHRVFARLAHAYHTTVVAGSILLPSPGVKDGLLAPGGGALQNISVTYRPDGSPHEEVVRKAFPTSDELPFTQPAPAQALPIIETPAGRLGVLICADSWQPACYQVLGARHVDMVAVPSFLGPQGIWSQPWKGYDGAAAPADVNPDDRGKLTEGQAWIRYALPGRISRAGARWGVNVFLHGQLWNLSSDGRTMVVHSGHVTQVRTAQRAAIVNLWMD